MAGYSMQSGESAATDVPYTESGDVSDDGVDNTTSTGTESTVSNEPSILERLICAEPSHLARKHKVKTNPPPISVKR